MLKKIAKGKKLPANIKNFTVTDVNRARVKATIIRHVMMWTLARAYMVPRSAHWHHVRCMMNSLERSCRLYGSGSSGSIEDEEQLSGGQLGEYKVEIEEVFAGYLGDCRTAVPSIDPLMTKTGYKVSTFRLRDQALIAVYVTHMIPLDLIAWEHRPRFLTAAIIRLWEPQAEDHEQVLADYKATGRIPILAESSEARTASGFTKFAAAKKRREQQEAGTAAKNVRRAGGGEDEDGEGGGEPDEPGPGGDDAVRGTVLRMLPPKFELSADAQLMTPAREAWVRATAIALGASAEDANVKSLVTDLLLGTPVIVEKLLEPRFAPLCTYLFQIDRPSLAQGERPGGLSPEAATAFRVVPNPLATKVLSQSRARKLRIQLLVDPDPEEEEDADGNDDGASSDSSAEEQDEAAQETGADADKRTAQATEAQKLEARAETRKLRHEARVARQKEKYRAMGYGNQAVDQPMMMLFENLGLSTSRRPGSAVR